MNRVCAVRALHRGRAGARARPRAYAAYLVAMTVIVVVLPVGRALAIASAELGASGVLDPAPAVAAVAGLALPAVVVLGRVRGPAVGEPHTTAVLLATDLRRWRVLRRPALTATTALALVGTVASALVALAAAAPVGPAAIGGAAFSVLLALAWLAGQCLPARLPAVLAAVLTAVAVLGLLVPAVLPVLPAGLVAAAVAGREPVGAVVALVALAVALLPAAPRMLDLARGPLLLAQARQWSSTARLGATGDLADSLSGYRALPSRGRRLRAVRVAPFALAVPVRDAIGALRTPGRSASALVALGAAGAAVVLAAVVPSALLAVPAAAAGVLAYLGAGVWSDGFRHAAATAGQPALVAPPPFELLLLHGLLPVVLAVAVALLGALSASLLLPGSALPVAAAKAVVAVAARAMDATRGPLPPSLLGPVPLPFGDGAGAVVLLWNLAGVLVSAAAAVALASAPALVAGVPLVAACCLLVARRRLARA
ncbi:hypothetical protein EV639_102185 [Rathayibacter tanaceti]|uniref:Uncharacterized protein n=2 Tax=Rathayibacter tanaceti TaxID=1671680 RepID=A0ACD2XMD9_9MICO|nr:hypothetical protein [Rathayibacter tanaceti]QHC54994.1 hypothetical protein GSU10_04600 [Rathayibacter tanaceti]TCO38541.1 hypothetical protein EV639_102185 [Rathayibacter tanaceti]